MNVEMNIRGVMFNLAFESLSFAEEALKGLVFTEKIEEITVIGVMLT